MPTLSFTASSFTTGFSESGNEFYYGSEHEGNTFNAAIGYTAENPNPSTIEPTYVVRTGGAWTEGRGYADFSFDFSDIPDAAIITAISVSCYGSHEQYPGEHAAYASAEISLFSGSTQKGTAQSFTAAYDSASKITLSDPGTWTRAELETAVLRFTVAMYGGTISGITWAVTYESTDVHYVASTNNVANLLVEPQYQYCSTGDSATVTITGESITNSRVFDNNVDVTSQLVYQGQTEPATVSDNTVLGTFTLLEGGFSGSTASTYFAGLVGKGVDNAQTTSNYYSSGSSTIAVFTYNLIFVNIPLSAQINNITCQVNGHAESTSNASEYMCVQLVCGETAISDELNFKTIGTSNSTQTITASTLPTAAQLSDLKLKCRLGYYGGAINGATCYITYTIGGQSYWTYTILNISTNHNIIVAYPTPKRLYSKINGVWVPARETYKKISTVWTLTDPSEMVDLNQNYLKG